MSRTKRCANPYCRKPFVPGHYGQKQLVGTGPEHVAEIPCDRCGGTGERGGNFCRPCGSRGKISWTCATWYKRKHPASVKRDIAPETLNRAFEAARHEDLRYWALLVAASYSGRRKGELLGLTWRDVESGSAIAERISVGGQWDDRKGFVPYKEPVAVQLLAPLRQALSCVRATIGATDPLDARIWPCSEAQAWSRWVKLQQRLKIENPATKRPYRFEDLRL